MAENDNVVSFPVESKPTALETAITEASIELDSEGPLGFRDLAAGFNMRDWLQAACERAGGKMTAAGMGFGVADIWIELDGHTFEVTIKPINR